MAPSLLHRVLHRTKPQRTLTVFFALCLGVKIVRPELVCDTFVDFVTYASQGEGQEALASFNEGIVQPCLGAGLRQKSTCRDYIVKANVEQSLGDLIPGASPAERVESCINDIEDRRRIATAQILVPAAIAALAAGLAIGVAEFVLLASGTQKVGLTFRRVMVISSAVAALLGCALVTSGLLLVRTAPVYASVGTCNVDKPCYNSGLSGKLAYGCILAPLLASIFLFGSISCCKSKTASADALTTKTLDLETQEPQVSPSTMGSPNPAKPRYSVLLRYFYDTKNRRSVRTSTIDV